MDYCPELELYREVKPNCLFGVFQVAFRKMIADFKFYNPEMEKLKFSKGLADAMKRNGWWEEKIKEYV
ncbi:MAG: hypothetical protein IKE41_01885 [Clostridia bacterium]|nr:hypothetical protein [Clostridia bacterium]